MRTWIVLTAIVSFSLFGERKLGLEEALRLAVSNSLALSSQKAFVEEAKWGKVQAGSWRNPDFSASLGQKSSGSVSGLALDLGLAQSFYFPGKLPAKVAAANAVLNHAETDHAALARAARLETLVLFYRYAAAEERSAHLSERLRRLETIESYLRGRPFASPQKKAERIIVENKILLLQKDGEEAELRKKTAWNALAARLRLADGIVLDVKWFQKGAAPAFEEWRKSALEKNPGLRRLHFERERLKKERLLAALDWLPDPGFSFLYRQESLGTETERFIGGGLSLSLPVFHFNVGAVRSLDARIAAIGFQIQEEEKNFQMNLRNLREDFEACRKQLLRFPISRLASLDASLGESDRDFQKGQVELLTYLELDALAGEIHEAVFESQEHFAETLSEIFKLCAFDEIRVE